MVGEGAGFTKGSPTAVFGIIKVEFQREEITGKYLIISGLLIRAYRMQEMGFRTGFKVGEDSFEWVVALSVSVFIDFCNLK